MLLDVHLLHCPLIELLLLEWETLLYFLMIFIIIILLLFAILFSQEIATHRSVISFLSKTIKLYSYQICWLWAYLITVRLFQSWRWAYLITVRLFQSWRWAYLITVIPELALGVPDYGYSRVGVGRTWLRLFQKRVVRIKFYMYALLSCIVL